MSVTITPLSARVDVACLSGALSVVPVSPDGSVAIGVQGASVRIAAVPSGVQVVPVVSTPRVTLFSVGYPGPPGPQGPQGPAVSGGGGGGGNSYFPSGW
jgi:hypothetical protein